MVEGFFLPSNPVVVVGALFFHAGELFFYILGVDIMVLPMISKKYTTELFLQPSFTFHLEP